MGPAYYVIAILGCADGSTACTQVATVPARYESVTSCRAETASALSARTDFDFPTLIAECRPVEAQPLAGQPARVPAGARHG